MATKKPNLVLVPGLLCTAELWKPQLAALSSSAEIMVADHTGHDSIRSAATSPTRSYARPPSA